MPKTFDSLAFSASAACASEAFDGESAPVSADLDALRDRPEAPIGPFLERGSGLLGNDGIAIGVLHDWPIGGPA